MRGVPVLGIDLFDTVFGRFDAGLTTIQGSFQGLARLTRQFSGKVHCISVMRNSFDEAVFWNVIAESGFLDATDIPEKHLHLCPPDDLRERGSQKNGLCAHYGVTHFVDANVNALCALSFVRRWFLLDHRSQARGVILPNSVIVAPTWEQLLRVCDPARE